MSLLTGRERAFLRAISKLAYANPYLPERLDAEREVLGREFEDVGGIRSLTVEDPSRADPNRMRTDRRLEEVVPAVRSRLAGGAEVLDDDLVLYQDAVFLLLYRRHLDGFRELATPLEGSRRRLGRVRMYASFLRDWRHFFAIPAMRWQPPLEAAHVFACLYQIQRAFHHTFAAIVGRSEVAAALRASVWQSIFTHDMRRYRDILCERMGDATTLITGPTGTGKELVARAIGLSRYIPFDAESTGFAEDPFAGLHALNLSAMPSTLIESELFGHTRGAFTGAVADRKGWLEICSPYGTVFLDEIGELEPSIQVKLLRVLQTRSFQSIGDTMEKRFAGKIVAATNRDLARAMQSGALREDFYYRLCSDVIVTPSLREQLREAPEVLHELIVFIAGQVAGVDPAPIVADAEAWILEHLGAAYPWPGNIRELEQCVRSIMIRGSYRPPSTRPVSPIEAMLRDIEHGTLTADELLSTYCTLVYAQTGNYQECARRLQLDRRTVKSRVDETLLTRLAGPEGDDRSDVDHLTPQAATGGGAHDGR
jgi:transcriptional regulator with AAA-type ATPase domain